MGWLSKDAIKTLLWWAVPVLAAIVIGITLRNHIQYVKDLEGDKRSLIQEGAKLRADLLVVEGVNKENERLANQYRALQKVNKDIGDAEDLIAATRNDFYERLRDDISQNSSVPQCDLALVQRTLDSLWERKAPTGD